MLEFEIKLGEETRKVVLEQAEVVIGRRNEKREVHLDLTPDDLVSRLHARVWLEDGSVIIEDLGSSGGTRVNHQKITGPTVLQATTKVELGKTRLTIRQPAPKRKRGGAPKKPAGKDRPRRPRPRRPAGSADEEPEVDVEVEAPEHTPEQAPEAQPATGEIQAEVTIEGATQMHAFDGGEIRIGRQHPGSDISLDLSADLLVSRNHARVWQTRAICWVEDLGSTHGTRVNGNPIEGACVIQPEDEVQIGSVILRFWVEAVPKARRPAKPREAPVTEGEDENVFPTLDSYPVFKEDSYRYHAPDHRAPEDLEEAFLSRKSPMGRIRTTHERALSEPFLPSDDAAALLEQLPNLPRELDAQPDAVALAEWLVNQLPDWLEGVQRAALFTIDFDQGRIKVLAHVPALKPILSDSLAHRALDLRTAFAWKQVSKKESVRRLSMYAGLYVPLIAENEELGILCVEDTAEEGEFSEGQLSALILISQLAAVYLQNRLWKEAGK
jgi:pSer/pThr/pTyr-binding forkhead associated (FHA) protein